jgi:ketosteroid isomerase-like protein
MRRSSVVFIAAVFVLAVWWLYAPASAAIAGPEDSNKSVEATITELERAWAAAIVNRDTATLERLLAKEFNGTSPNAHTYSREMAIGDLKSGVYVVDKMDLDEISVNVFGNTAVAFTSQEEKSRYGNEDFSGHYHYTDMWVKRGGRWQVVASHGSRFDEAH